MTAEKVVFEQTIDGLFLRALGSRIKAPTRERLRGVGLDLDKKLMPAYPFPVWMKALRAVAEDLYPGETMDVAMFKVGESFIDGYNETLLGRALLGMLKVLGPRRAIQRATANFRTGNNYTDAKASELGPTAMELWMNEVGDFPTFTGGIVSGALKAAGVEPKIEVASYDGHACTYRVTWSLRA